jgi:hypothetical protein
MQGLKGFSRIVQRTDVPPLRRGAVLELFDPAQGQPLGPAHVRAVFIDPACARSIEKGAGPFRVGVIAQEQIGMMASDVVRFHFEDAQPFDAATVTAFTANQASCMQAAEFLHPLVHLLVKSAESVNRRDTSFHFLCVSSAFFSNAV